VFRPERQIFGALYFHPAQPSPSALANITSADIPRYSEEIAFSIQLLASD